MQAAGQMPRGDVAGFIPKNIITRSLGPHPDVRVDLEGPFPLEVGDTFLVCSDGLSGQVKDEEIGVVLATLSPAEAVRALVDMANLRGGPDNVTAVVARVLTVDSNEASLESSAASNDEGGSAPQPLLWGMMAIAVLAALGLVASEYYTAALLGGFVAAALGVWALVQSSQNSGPRARLDLKGALGSGPHTVRDCPPDAEAVAVLCQMAQQLREAAKEEHWTLDWSRFNSLGERAQAALTAGDFAGAVRHYALAISFMMNEIRHQPSRKDERDRSVLDM
jgi:protein phosphatase